MCEVVQSAESANSANRISVARIVRAFSAISFRRRESWGVAPGFCRSRLQRFDVAVGDGFAVRG
jgi:hypothetical protein